MKYGVFCAYWKHEWEADFTYYARKVSDLGFDILEVPAGQLLTMSDQELEDLKVLTKDLGIEITSNIGPDKDKDVASADPAVREAGIKFLTDIMKAMDRLDSRVLAGVIYSYWPCDFTDVDKKAAWERSVASVKQLAGVAESLGIDYCLEVVNRFENFLLNTSAEAVQFCQDVDSEKVKVHLDTFHMNIEEDSISGAIRTAGDYLGHLHVGESNRKVPGKGHLPWDEIGQALHDVNYDAGVVMEPFVLPGGQIARDIKVWRDLSGNADEAKLDKDLKQSLEFLRGKF